ncbi:unnamed protein product [Thlaspi arvense]|uniref:Uncharacterized protein n=1 Tax=Thlaspi arvense TaxID=13288 RepID=A0AAU9RCP4_THLAR|nr:unnamed protein product [Thlaspi arvense]
MESANLLNKQEEARSPSSFTYGVLLSTSVAVAGSFCYGCAMSYSSPAQSKIMEELGLSVADYSFFTSVMTLGGMITAAVSGKLAALIGRRRTMWISDVCCTFGWLAVAFGHDIMLLNVGRLFLGFGVGLVSYVVPVYIAEITPKTFRGGFTFSNQLMQCFGISLMFFTGNLFHWRTLALLSAIPCASQAICLFFIPESPRWLAMYGRDRELEITLTRLRGDNVDILEEAAEIRETVKISRRESQNGVRDLFHMRNAHSLIIGLGLMLLQQFCGSSAISAYAASIFDKAGFPIDIGTTILAAILVPQSIVVILTVDRWGRRPLLMISSIGVCICSFLIGLSYYLQKDGEFQKFCSVLLIVGIMVDETTTLIIVINLIIYQGYVSFFCIGLGGIPWVIMSEVFPVNVKIAAGSLVTVSNWFFSWIVVYSFNFMMQWSSSGTYFIFTGVSVVTIIFIWVLVPETKGRTLEEIQASLVQLSTTLINSKTLRSKLQTIKSRKLVPSGCVVLCSLSHKASRRRLEKKNLQDSSMVVPPISRSSFLPEVDTNFHAYCFSLANRIDAAIGNDEVMVDAQDLPRILNQVCQRGCNHQTRAVIMALMISAKSACQLGWFPQRESQELLALVDSMWKGFSSPENVTPTLNSPVSLIPQVMERFYPFLKLGNILVSSEGKTESNMLVKDFHISKKMLQHSTKLKVGLLVFRTEDISKSSCIIHPQEVSFLLNGKNVEKRASISMDSGPQCPTDVTALLNPGSNLLQAIGCFGGSYFIIIALLDDIPLPVNPLLKNYVHSKVIESNSDEISEGPSRISLSCPISRTRIKLPVKGHVCKHLQCFDFWNYVNINTRIPSWRCPHCNQSVCYTDIRKDQNMIKILGEVARDATDVIISADGSWRVATESDENMEVVQETTHDHGDPNSFINVGPTVLDLTRDENEWETSVVTQVNEHKPCSSEIRGPPNSTHNPATMLNQFCASINALPQFPQTLNVFDLQQQLMNFPPVENTRDSAVRQASPMTFSSRQDGLATNTGSFHMSMPAAHSSQFQGSYVTPLGHCQGRTPDLMERWNHIYGITQTQLPPMPPPLQNHYALQNLRLPIRNVSPAQERPMPSYTHPQTLAVNYGGTSDQRHMQIPMQRPVQRMHPGGAAEQLLSREFMNLTSANTANWQPQTRMRGSIMPGSTGYDHMIIRPTRPVQAQAQTLAPPQPTAYNDSIADEVQAFLAHPSYPIVTNETQAGIGSLPVSEGVGASGSFWSMPPEAW